MTASIHIIQDEHDRLYGPTRLTFGTTDEAVVYAQEALSCGCKGEVVAVFDEDGEEVEVEGLVQGGSGGEPPAQSATKAEWEDYARSQGLTWPSTATKSDIIALVEGK